MAKIGLFLTLVLSALLRYYNNTAVALWHDEAFSALYITKYGWGEMMHRIVLDVHPPLYYIVLRFWSYVFGSSLLSLRGLSILLGVLTVWAGYMLVKQAFKRENWALLAALLLAVNPFQIQYALEARMYTLGTFLVLLSSYLLLKALEDQKKKYWIMYGISVGAAALTHYFLLFSIAAQGIYWLYIVFKRHKLNFFWAKNFIWGAVSFALGGLLYVPWLPAFFEQRARVESGYWIAPPDAWAIPGTVWKMMFGGTGINRTVLFIATTVSILLILYLLIKLKHEAKWLIFSGVFVPLAASLYLSMQTSIYMDRYFVFASLFFAMMIGLAFAQIQKPFLRRLMITLLVAASIFTFFMNWKELDVKNIAFGRDINRKPGIAEAAKKINKEARENDRIFVGTSFIFFTFQYYNETGVTPLLLSGSQLQHIPHYSGTAILTEEDLQMTENGMIPADAVKDKVSVWLLWTTGFGGSKPLVPVNWKQVQEKEYVDSPGFKGSIFVTQYTVN
jgi:mannosyltransferase